jgi:hypothetical protein
MNEWEDFKAQLKKVGAGIKAWTLLHRPQFELWAREGGEGCKAFAIAILQGEAGRAKAMALNTGSDATTVLGFNVGLIERDAFWIVVQGFLAGGKLPGWILPIIAELLKQIRGEKP